MEAGGALSPAEFSGNGRVQIQNDLFGEVAVQKTGESISRNDHQVRRLKPDDAFGNAAELQSCCLNRKLKFREIIICATKPSETVKKMKAKI